MDGIQHKKFSADCQDCGNQKCRKNKFHKIKQEEIGSKIPVFQRFPGEPSNKDKVHHPLHGKGKQIKKNSKVIHGRSLYPFFWQLIAAGYFYLGKAFREGLSSGFSCNAAVPGSNHVRAAGKRGFPYPASESPGRRDSRGHGRG